MNRCRFNLPDYPVLELRSPLQGELAKNRIPVLSAPPGSGKSTLVPFFLLNADWRQGRTIFLLQPRRPAVRALASRLDQLAGGQARIGYITRYEHSVPKRPDIIVMTEGIFIRRLLEDPEAADTAAVLLDEFHERSLATDLAYVLGRQCRELFRPDLRMVVMSATLDAQQFTGDPFSLLQAEGSLHPVQVDYRPPPTAARIEEYGAKVCRQQLQQNSGSILFFLPGEAEIRRAAEALDAEFVKEPLLADVDVYPLYGRLSPAEQNRAIAPPKDGHRKVVIATNIAETSLTIEGITCVVDSGLRRRSRWDPDTGLSRLETLRISAASAEQRAGRAGRLAPGTVLRLWEARERLAEFDPPEMAQADLSGLFLTLAVWGDPQGESCPWPNPPDPQRRDEALQLLHELEAIDKSGVPTPKGTAMARMPLPPRLAAMLSAAAAAGTTYAVQTAALTAAVLEHGDPLRKDLRDTYGADLDLRVQLLEQARMGNFPTELSRGPAVRILQEAERLEKLAGPRTAGTTAATDPAASPAALLLSAYPDRLARRTDRGPGAASGAPAGAISNPAGSPSTARYRLAGGTEARLVQGERGFAPEWIVAGALHRGQREGRIYLAAALSEAEAQEFISEHGRSEESLTLDENGQLRARRLRLVGSLQVSSTPVPPSELTDPAAALLELIRSTGLQALPWNRNADELRRRMVFLHAVKGEPWPEVSDQALLDTLEEWLAPFLPRKIAGGSLQNLPLAEALRARLPWELQGRLDDLAPQQFTLPSGTSRRLRYEGGRCTLAARIQQLFGLTHTPRVAGVPIEIELLSPARRPVQVTRDLHSFWSRTYPEVRKELRGRYPKHYWPEDPFSAIPTDRAKPSR